MSKNIRKIFLIIATLVFALIMWGVFFGGGGVMKTAWNTVIKPVNTSWTSISGSDDPLIPAFDDAVDGGYEGNEGLEDASGGF